MKLVYRGKTKDVYALKDGHYLLKFKDELTGADGVFDPGANTVGLSMEGAGRAGLSITKYFFDILREQGIPTHYVEADLEKATMVVKPATMFGHGLEVICRYRAAGSFIRRYGLYAREGQPLDAFVEFTLKDDQRGDPPISEDALIMLGILTQDEYQTLVHLTKQIASVVKEELAKHQIELYDIKFEFGRIGEEQQVALIDEISGGNLRAYRRGKYVQPIELAQIIVGRN